MCKQQSVGPIMSDQFPVLIVEPCIETSEPKADRILGPSGWSGCSRAKQMHHGGYQLHSTPLPLWATTKSVRGAPDGGLSGPALVRGFYAI